jgi:acetyltransferase-like isoleucine patch superfamily enzyme
MPITITDQGSDNRIELPPSAANANGSILCRGSGNEIRIGNVTWSGQVTINARDRCRISIADEVRTGRLEIYCGDGVTMTIGRGTAINGMIRLHSHEPATISIGEGCLIAGGVAMATSDVHGVYDLETGTRLNRAADISVCDRVWIAGDAQILKGVMIGSGSVIGTGAIVTKSVPPNCVAAGNPARVVRSGITWHFSRFDVLAPELRR